MTAELDHIVEAIIFASPEGASTKEIARCIRSAVASSREADAENAPEHITRHVGTTEEEVVAAIYHLNLAYIETGRAFMLVERAAGWRIVSRMDYALWVRELFPDKKPTRLTPSALETLAIIAYRQPMTKSSIEAVRGVSIDGPLQTLLDRNIVRIAGRADLPGRPLLYETTDLFLEHFGIKNVEELPNSSELRSVKLPEPPAADAPTAQQQELNIIDENNEATPKEKLVKGKKVLKEKKEKKAAAEETRSAGALATVDPSTDETAEPETLFEDAGADDEVAESKDTDSESPAPEES